MHVSLSLFIITHADESRGSIAFIRVCLSVVCLCVCPHDRTKTAETTVTKLATGIIIIMSHGYPFNIRSNDQRSRSWGHKVLKNIFQDLSS